MSVKEDFLDLNDEYFRRLKPLALMGTASFPAPSFGQERYSGQQDKAPKKTSKNNITYYQTI